VAAVERDARRRANREGLAHRLIVRSRSAGTPAPPRRSAARARTRASCQVESRRPTRSHSPAKMAASPPVCSGSTPQLAERRDHSWTAPVGSTTGAMIGCFEGVTRATREGGARLRGIRRPRADGDLLVDQLPGQEVCGRATSAALRNRRTGAGRLGRGAPGGRRRAVAAPAAGRSGSVRRPRSGAPAQSPAREP
jgi:hypothetical protein